MLSNKAVIIFFHRYWNAKDMNADTVLFEVEKPIYINQPEYVLKISCLVCYKYQQCWYLKGTTTYLKEKKESETLKK